MVAFLIEKKASTLSFNHPQLYQQANGTLGVCAPCVGTREAAGAGSRAAFGHGGAAGWKDVPGQLLSFFLLSFLSQLDFCLGSSPTPWGAVVQWAPAPQGNPNLRAPPPAAEGLLSFSALKIKTQRSGFMARPTGLLKATTGALLLSTCRKRPECLSQALQAAVKSICVQGASLVSCPHLCQHLQSLSPLHPAAANAFSPSDLPSGSTTNAQEHFYSDSSLLQIAPPAT